MLTVFAVVAIAYLCAAGFVSFGLAVIEREWLLEAYSDDSMANALRRGALAVIALPLFIGCTLAYAVYRKRRRAEAEESKCAMCLYRLAAEKDETEGGRSSD